MDAIIIADRTRPELAPLTDRTAAALLPVASKPLIEHALDALQKLGLRRAFVVTSPFAEHVEAALGSGRRWGIDLQFTLTCGDEPMEQLLERFRGRIDGAVLLVRADFLYGNAIGEFLREVAELPDVAACFATSRGRLLGLDLFRFDRAGKSLRPALLRARAVEVSGAVFEGLDSLRAYHEANLRVARDPAGLSLPVLEANSGYRVGRRSRISEGSRCSPPTLAGAHCWVQSGAELKEEVVLSDRVLVDRGASLRRTVVLPGTFVGEKVELENAIVWGRQLIRVDTGSVSELSDEILLAELETNPLMELFGETVNRIGGALLLLLSLPLWPLFFLLSFIANPRRPWRRERLVGNRLAPSPEGGLRPATFSCWRGAASIPWLRHLPRIVAVARGDLKLVGVRPLSRRRRAALREEWQRVREAGQSGLTGPALTLSGSASETEILLEEGLYVQTRSAKAEIRLLLESVLALAKGRAWRFARRRRKAGRGVSSPLVPKALSRS